MSLQPVQILQQNAQEEKGENARMVTILFVEEVIIVF